ncbi:hypothetical protein QBC43DRAFT_370754 [Cladorrhinum sp. PSN259]|nr:hypothetical protein QBC43DRAFT_370754 [Cladorrhinum sp. PSN259]
MPLASTPVYLLTELSPEVVSRFLADAYAYSEGLAPGAPQNLNVISAQSTADTTVGGIIEPEDDDDDDDDKKAEMVARKLESPATKVFVILDSRSARDDTALLVERTSRGADNGDMPDAPSHVETARVKFSAVQSLVLSLEIANISFVEIQSIASRGPGGAYDPGPHVGSGPPPRKGGPAPRKQLRPGLPEVEDGSDGQ